MGAGDSQYPLYIPCKSKWRAEDTEQPTQPKSGDAPRGEHFCLR